MSGGLLLQQVAPHTLPREMIVSLPLLLLAGVMVGYGARLGSGCTSGHGVCGVARFSPRSLVSTLTFTASGAIAVLVLRHLFGGA